MIERILALDSLVNLLSFDERIWLQRQRLIPQGIYYGEPPETIEDLCNLILKYKWVTPKIKYNQDRCKVFLHPKTGNWEPIETYKHPILQEAINLISIIE
ncbi:hypothetical protein [Wenyingzhuangia aestuarii]|uniref:hypothetical protein n=1 Tax=Wenyingzhuangia aestuarii TaxID=1647582 RepID=UPI00143BE5A9|nr:hypothetical protein [Wenyingzhuangia aestuarii]NJB83651.1 hypothetical protein [Wenyingzhuangia aestuarii]